jgi:hypothetical protein
MDPLVAVALATVAFALYVEASPTMGGIWIRPDELGAPRLVPLGLVRLMVAPLRLWTPTGRAFWTAPGLWPVNWPLVVLAVIGMAVLCRLSSGPRPLAR